MSHLRGFFFCFGVRNEFNTRSIVKRIEFIRWNDLMAIRADLFTKFGLDDNSFFTAGTGGNRFHKGIGLPPFFGKNKRPTILLDIVFSTTTYFSSGVKSSVNFLSFFGRKSPFGKG